MTVIHDNDGNNITEFPEVNGKRVMPVYLPSSLTAFGDLRVAELSPLLQFSFEYTVKNTELTTRSLNNGGTVEQSYGMAVAATSTTTGSKAKMTCHQHVRYKAGLGGLMRFTALFTTGVAGTSQWMGLLGSSGTNSDFLNGYAVGYNGANFGIVRFSDDVTNFTALSACDDPLDGTGMSGMTLDPTKLNVFFIQYQYLGAGAISFFAEKQDGTMTKFHTIQYAGLNTQPSVMSPNFHLTMYADNKATTSDLIVKSASMAFFIEGKTRETEIQQFNESTGRKQKTTVSTEIALFTIRVKAQYAMKLNLITIQLLRISLGIEANAANNLGQFRVVRNTTLGGTPVFNDISTSDSVVDMDTAGTTLTGGDNLFGGDLAGKNDKVIENLSDYKIFMHPGDTITLAVSSANSATINGSMMWKELF
jgi:hypothetical protein